MEIITADLWDDFSSQLKCATPIFKIFGLKKSFYGEITTLKLHEDNSLVRERLGEDGKGKVLIIDGGGSLRCALIGDRLATKAIENGWEGIVVFGCIRDSKVINEMEIGIKALNTIPVKSIKRGIGLKDEVVNFAEVEFVPGHFIYSDEDGILVSNKLLLNNG